MAEKNKGIRHFRPEVLGYPTPKEPWPNQEVTHWNLMVMSSYSQGIQDLRWVQGQIELCVSTFSEERLKLFLWRQTHECIKQSLHMSRRGK